MDVSPSESASSFLLTRISILLLLYSLSQHFFPDCPIPLTLCILGMISSLYKTKSFSWLVNCFIKTNNSSKRQGLIDAVLTLKRYESATLAWNARKVKNSKRINFIDQKQAKAIRYYDHINRVEKAIIKNGTIAKAIAKKAIMSHEITNLELRSGTFKENSRTIESLCHFARDWTELGDPELKPLLNYIKTNIYKAIPTSDERKRTLVVVPGSGLGRIAHELATMEPAFKKVHAVEFSALMYLCNQFLYSKVLKSFQIYPYLHSYSHHVSVDDHLRSTTLYTKTRIPGNLTLNYADFREFTISNMDQYDHVLIVTAFFIDTAQNLFDYFKGIERIIGDKKGLWINIGPLKYGTAPFIELSLDELRRLRKLRGWKDVDEPLPYGSEVSGYLTDTKGLWQGYYGLGRWTSTFNRD